LPPPPEKNWETPSGDEPTTLEKAQAGAAFDVVVPTNLTDPTVYLTNPAADSKDRTVVLLYHTDCGPVELSEQVAPIPDADFEAYVKGFVASFKGGDPSWPGFAEVVSVRDDLPGLVSITPGNTATLVHWQEGGVQLILSGPEISEGQALNLVNGL
jgi:hypothetical protein